MTKLRGHSDLANSIARTTAAFDIVYLDGTDPRDVPTQPLTPVADDDAALDAEIEKHVTVVKRIEHFETEETDHE